MRWPNLVRRRSLFHWATDCRALTMPAPATSSFVAHLPNPQGRVTQVSACVTGKKRLQPGNLKRQNQCGKKALITPPQQSKPAQRGLMCNQPPRPERILVTTHPLHPAHWLLQGADCSEAMKYHPPSTMQGFPRCCTRRHFRMPEKPTTGPDHIILWMHRCDPKVACPQTVSAKSGIFSPPAWCGKWPPWQSGNSGSRGQLKRHIRRPRSASVRDADLAVL